jgi:hypothetical protein
MALWSFDFSIWRIMAGGKESRGGGIVKGQEIFQREILRFRAFCAENRV